ncbi:hypothetical protein DRJ19_01700 [Candidatus Woesearchaeota archaeon]|nr:MAG: hypothetical protein DRJ19_01700 [Candidatus Woesearchaeota archaeon]
MTKASKGSRIIRRALDAVLDERKLAEIIDELMDKRYRRFSPKKMEGEKKYRLNITQVELEISRGKKRSSRNPYVSVSFLAGDVEAEDALFDFYERKGFESREALMRILNNPEQTEQFLRPFKSLDQLGNLTINRKKRCVELEFDLRALKGKMRDKIEDAIVFCLLKPMLMVGAPKYAKVLKQMREEYLKDGYRQDQ